MPQDIISQFQRTYAFPIEVYRSVANIAGRDAIPTSVRWQGMLVYVVTDATTYELSTGISNSDWIDLKQQINIIVEDNVTSTSVVNALSANQGRLLQDQIDVLSTPAWGSITGTLSNQTDLNNALNQRLTDAPIDGSTYARNNGGWTVVETFVSGFGSGSANVGGSVSGLFGTVTFLGGLPNDWQYRLNAKTVCIQVAVTFSSPGTMSGDFQITLTGFPGQYLPQDDYVSAPGFIEFNAGATAYSGIWGSLQTDGTIDILYSNGTTSPTVYPVTGITDGTVRITFTYNIP